MKWPEDKIIVVCGEVERLSYAAPGSTKGKCRLCGKEVWVSDNTPIAMKKALEERKGEKFTGYDFCCNSCADKLFERIKESEIIRIENPHFQDWRFN